MDLNFDDLEQQLREYHKTNPDPWIARLKPASQKRVLEWRDEAPFRFHRFRSRLLRCEIRKDREKRKWFRMTLGEKLASLCENNDFATSLSDLDDTIWTWIKRCDPEFYEQHKALMWE